LEYAGETMNLKQKGGHHQNKKADYLVAFLWQRRATELTAARSLNVVGKTTKPNH